MTTTDMVDMNEVEKLANEIYKQKLEELKLEKKQYRSEYYQQNKQKEYENTRKWLEDNKDYYLEKRRQDYKNRKVKCETCGVEVPKYYYYRHIRTKKHINNMNN